MARTVPIVTAALLSAILAPVAGLEAQPASTRLAPGDVIRFRPLPSGPRVSGTVVWISSDSLRLNRSAPRLQELYLRENIARLERRLPGPDGAWIGALSGFAIGGGLGALWGRAVCHEICEGGESGAGLMLLLGGALGGLGALTGALVGHIAYPVEWAVATWPTDHGAALGVAIPIRLPDPG